MRRIKISKKIFYSVLIVLVLLGLSGFVFLFSGEKDMEKIYIIPVGDISDDLIGKLKEAVEKAYGIPACIKAGFSDVEFAYNKRREQYLAPLILKDMKKYLPDDGLRLVGITDKDLYDSGLNFIFGEAGGRT